jgi:hypothetical protein
MFICAAILAPTCIPDFRKHARGFVVPTTVPCDDSLDDVQRLIDRGRFTTGKFFASKNDIWPGTLNAVFKADRSVSGTRERRPFPFHEFENHLQGCGESSAQQDSQALFVEQHEIASIIAAFAAA